MQKQHEVTMSATKYPGGLRIFECVVCDYAFAAEVGEHNVIQYETKETINYGDIHVSHVIMQIPDDPLTLRMSASSDAMPEEEY